MNKKKRKPAVYKKKPCKYKCGKLIAIVRNPRGVCPTCAAREKRQAAIKKRKEEEKRNPKVIVMATCISCKEKYDPFCVNDNTKPGRSLRFSWCSPCREKKKDIVTTERWLNMRA